MTKSTYNLTQSLLPLLSIYAREYILEHFPGRALGKTEFLLWDETVIHLLLTFSLQTYFKNSIANMRSVVSRCNSERDPAEPSLGSATLCWCAIVGAGIVWVWCGGENWVLTIFRLLLLPLPLLPFPTAAHNRQAQFLLCSELLQVSFYFSALTSLGVALWLCAVSTSLLIGYLLTPGLPAALTASIALKHFAVWQTLGWFCSAEEKSAVSVGLAVLWGVLCAGGGLAARGGALGSAGKSQPQGTDWKGVLEVLQVGIVVVRQPYSIVTYNQAVLDLLHVDHSNSTTSLLSALNSTVFLPEYSKYSPNTTLQGSISHFFRSKNQVSGCLGVAKVSERYLEWSINECSWERKAVCVVSCRDISRWVESETRARRDSDSKSALVRSVSHELRTPTNAIINLVQDIQEKEHLSQESMQDVAMLINSSHFLLSMINDLLDYSSLMSGRFGLSKQRFELKRALEECIGLVDLQCKHKHLDLILRFDPALPSEVYSDKNRLKQVVLNLLSNALKFTPAGRLELVALSVSDTHAGVRVIDTGIGIDEDKVDGIFEPFGKLEGNDRLNPQGCGLGLGISNVLVKSLGGSGIHVKSKRFSGSVFGFEFNIAEEAADLQWSPDAYESLETWEGVEQISVPLTADPSSNTPVDILIVEDVDYNRMVLRRMLETAGYQCAEAQHGVAAIQKLREQQRKGQAPAVVLMDVEMPEMDGLTATREIRRMAACGELTSNPVIIGCSAHSSTEDREACISVGMQHYLEKPINRDTLTRLVAAVIGRRARQRMATV